MARGAQRAAALPLVLALALILLASAVLTAPTARAASHAATLTATDTPAVTDTPTDTATPTATNTPAPTATATTLPTPTPTVKPNPYDLDLRAAANESGWPQGNSNWCGVATVALIADYVNPGSGVSQQGVLNALNDPTNASIWGTPSPAGWGPYLPADIARDFGTDPRSLAEGLTLATGRQYHVIVDTNGAWDTTVHIVHDLLVSKQPISVFVDHGQHSIVVSGVVATGNPLTDPHSITAIDVWDPGGGVLDKYGNPIGMQPQIQEKISISKWLSGLTSWSGWYGSAYFKYPYASNVYNGAPLDPDPAVGPYAYQTAKSNHMWIGHYVYISPLGGSATAGLSADWELTPGGALYVGYATAQYPAKPAGYAGPTVPMPNTAPPPPPPVRPPPKIAPKLPPAKPKATATPRPTATATVRPRSTPTSDAGGGPPSGDPPNACAPARCVLNAVTSGPAPYVIVLLLVLIIGMSLLAPTVAPALFGRRRRGAASAPIGSAGETPAPLPPASLGDAASASTGEISDAPTLKTAAETPTQPDSAAPDIAPQVTPEMTSQAAERAPDSPAQAVDEAPTGSLEQASAGADDASDASTIPDEPEANPTA